MLFFPGQQWITARYRLSFIPVPKCYTDSPTSWGFLVSYTRRY